MRKEVGKWLLDIAKYMATAVLLTSLFSRIEVWNWYMYVLTLLAVISTLVVGLLLLKVNKEDK